MSDSQADDKSSSDSSEFMEKIRKQSRANVKWGVDRWGLQVVNINLRLGPDLLIGVEKYASSENFSLDSAVMELIEDGLLARGCLPKWWKIRGFDPSS